MCNVQSKIYLLQFVSNYAIFNQSIYSTILKGRTQESRVKVIYKTYSRVKAILKAIQKTRFAARTTI